MKLYKLVLFILVLFIIPIYTYASPLTFTRTEDNPLVPKDVEVNEDNINDILNTPAVSKSDKIYDFIDLYTDEQEKIIKKDLDAFISETKMDALIVTTNDLKGFDLENYSYNFYDYNDFKTDGVILVISFTNQEPVIYMANSGKSVNIYTDARIQEILKYIYKDISGGNYYHAVGDYIKILNGFYNIDSGGNYKVNSNGVVVKNIQWFDIIILSFSLSFLFVMLIYYRVRNKNKIIFYDIFDSSIDYSSMVVKTVKDDVINEK